MDRQYRLHAEYRNGKRKAAGTDTEKLKELGNIIRAQYGNINGIALVRKGYLVYERYFNGYGPLDAHHVASVTKSVISALVGIAIDAGYIKSTEQKVLDFFPEYTSGPDDLIKRTVTIRHLLTMTAPFPFSWEDGDKRGREPLDRLRRQQNWIMYILNLMGGNARPGRFQYNTAGTHLLSAILTRTTGMCAREFANERLFRPAGMREIPDHAMKSFGLDDVFGKNVTGWVKDPDGNNTGGWGLTLTAGDMARLGSLYLNHGRWEGKQIISKNWIDNTIKESSSVDSKVNGCNGYGYLWWLKREKDIFAYLAMGDGGNIICCIPGKDLVIAISSGFIRNPKDRWPLIEKHILPVFTD